MLQGVTIDRQDVVGKGGEAIVYRARLGSQTIVAREVLMGPRYWNTPLGRKITRLVNREAITHSQLRHPNILPFLGIYRKTPGSPPIVILPYMEGGSLSDLLSDGPLTEAVEFTQIILGVSRGVLYLHSRNPPIIHGDLHPGNVLLDKFGNPYLCDFGLSRIRHEVTRTHTALQEGGRIRFLAPELSSGGMVKFRTSKESDIFSLAMTFLNIWTGKPPFSHVKNEQKVLAHFLKGQRPPHPASTITLEATVTTNFWNLIVNMWAQEPEKRPPIAHALNKLENMLARCKSQEYCVSSLRTTISYDSC
ncbi:kinase-like protein [Clavulina sp. PMI_390]|nr:kinase-like protein [Clavulina sp. PMI_390]